MMGLTNGFGIMGDLLGPSKTNSGIGKKTQSEIELTFGAKMRMSLVFMHLWLIAWALTILDKTVSLWERRSAERRNKLDKMTNKSVIIDVEVKENEDG